MLFTIFIVAISLIGLLIIHELGHFVFAKKFGVKVEEFGIGLPPRIVGKKIGETIYSLNLLPLGAFVKIKGEEGESEDPRSFSKKPIWQRAIIILGGIFSFWVVAFVIFSVVFSTGVPTAIPDELNEDLSKKIVQTPSVLLIGVNENSPADIAGLEVGDRIIYLKNNAEKIEPTKISEVQAFISFYQGEEIILGIQRGSQLLDIVLVPRISPPEGEGALGVALVRAGILAYPWYEAPLRAIETCVVTTYDIALGLGQALLRVVQGRPVGVELVGPIGIGKMVSQHFTLGINYFLQFIAVIALYLALFNLLPIPAVDGGRFVFLIIEKIKGSPINRKIEQNINGVVFAFLIILMILVTIKDIVKLF